MNASRPITRLAPEPWELVSGATYVMRDTDLDDIYVETVGETRIGHGFNKLGFLVSMPLDVPLCSGCDQPVADDGRCENCQTIHIINASLGEGINEALAPGRVM